MKRLITLTLMAGFAAVTMVAQADKAEDKFSCKCPVSGAPAKEAQSAEYKKAKVYFCCGNCKAAFAKDSKKHAVKANMQLVATKQFKQKGCPFSGADVKKDTMIKVGTTKVGFCCGNCKGKVESAEGEKQLAMVYSDKAFEKGFEMVKKEK